AKAAALQQSSINEGDVAALRVGEGSRLVRDAAPLVVNTEYLKNGTHKVRSTVIGTTAAYQNVFHWTDDGASAGSRWLDAHATDQAVIGLSVVKKLWPGVASKDVEGQTFTLEDADLKEHVFRVVGIMTPKSPGLATAQDNKIFVSLAAVRDLYRGATAQG